ncbi:hypothetical protein BST61_g8152 [Cercospora zeina]
MDPSTSQQLQGKRNARAWKRQFRIAALAKGVQDVFTGVFRALPMPIAKDYYLDAEVEFEEAEDGEEQTPEAADASGETGRRRTLDADDTKAILKRMAKGAKSAEKGTDFSGRLALYKFNLDEYDKGRKVVATAMALLITWVHPTLRGQLDKATDPKAAYDSLVARYSVSDALARENAEEHFNSITIDQFRNAQDYVNAIEDARKDVEEAGKTIDDADVISRLMAGVNDHPVYNEFKTLYHMLRSMDDKFDDLDNMITELLTFESNNHTRINAARFRPARQQNAGNAGRSMNAGRDRRQNREQCTACGIWGHDEQNYWAAHPDRRPNARGNDAFGQGGDRQYRNNGYGRNN